ncbi:MAG: IclR family transcriptional regulator [Nocardioidaceae bacterium]|nr:IclR family transcriptional regulator [Nocardioidaceae bacterium]NUS52305.1 IclR family transcriptional regulator [Nocardioidaceae bacterium]
MSESIRRAVQTLDLLARTDRDLSIRELADQAAVSKSAVQRILATLVEAGLAVQDPRSRRYGLGPRTLVLGTAYQKRIDLRSVALPHMSRLRDVTGETVGLSVSVGDELLHIEQVVSGSELRRTFDIGRTLPLWCGAPSRLLLADLPDEEVRRILGERRPSAIRPADPPSAEALFEAVRESRRTGYGLAFGETIAGVNTAAAPLRGADGRTVATLSVTGPSTRLDRDGLERCLPRLVQTAATVSGLLGHHA